MPCPANSHSPILDVVTDKGPVLVSEQFGFHQVAGDGATVHVDKAFPGFGPKS